MRIAVITAHPPSKGSLNEYAYHFVRYLRQKPEISEVILLVDQLPADQRYEFPDANLDKDNYLAPVQALPCWRFNDVTNPLRIVQALRQTKPDAVLFNLQFASFGDKKIAAGLGLLTPAIVKYLGFPTIVLLHNIMETVDLTSAGFTTSALVERTMRFFGTLATNALLRSDLVALTIPKYVEILTEKYKTDNVMLAPHGSFDEQSAEPTFDLPDGPRQVMTFGKFGTYKKIEPLVEAVRMLQNNGHPDVELVVAGSDSPNAKGYLDNVRRQFAEMRGLHFTGYVAEEDVPRIFREAAVVAFPYTSTTGSSGVLHQAGDYGKAVVLPNIGDFAELIQEEGYTGEFFEPDDARSMAKAITRILDDDTYREEMGMKNFRASQGIPISVVVDWYLLHFENLLETKKQND